MLLSTKTKLALLVAGSLIVLAAGVGLFSKYSVEKSMLEEQCRNASNIVQLATLNAFDHYQILFRTKTEQAIRLKTRMALLQKILQELTLNSDDPVALFRAFPLPAGVDLIALDAQWTPRYSSAGLKTLSPYSLRDIKERPVGEAMLTLAQKKLPATCLVGWQREGIFQRFYGVHFFLPKQGLLVGLWAGVRPLEEDLENIQQQNLAKLTRNFKKITLGNTGIIFALTSKGEVTIGQASLQPSLAQARTASGELLVELLAQAAAQPEKPLAIPASALLQKTEQTERMAALFVRYVKPLDWYVVGMAYEDEALAPGHRLSYALIAALCFAIVCILPIAMLIVSRLTRPLYRLAAYARSLPEQNFEKARPEDPVLKALAAGEGGLEMKELASSFLFMDKTLRSRVRELMEAVSSRERMAGELAAATEIQMDILPEPLPASVSGGRFLIAASLIPAREVGGDLYDFFMLDETHLCFVIGDVSGKGVPASLFMSMAVTLIRSHAKTCPSPERLMGIVNNSLASENTTCMFVTLFIGVLDVNSGEICYANGGHNQPLILGEAGAMRWLTGLSGPVVGAMEEVEYCLHTTQIHAGESLFLYTDGVNEAMNEHKEEYSYEAMQAALASSPSRVPVVLMQAVLEGVANHVQGQPASDDITILCIQYQPDSVAK
jgi:phosphoserine phosphatase RsbU/P